MRRVLSICVAFICLMSWAQVSAADLSGIRKILAQAPLLCGSFTQSKSLRALTRPLVSEGRVVFAIGKGVVWQILNPFPARLLVKRDILIRWDGDGVAKRVEFAQAPQFRALSDVFLAVFAGDAGRLVETFEIAADVGTADWRLTLKPRESGFASIIAVIHVSGGRFVDELRIVERRGDRTIIRFTGMTADNCVLSTAEKGHFAS